MYHLQMVDRQLEYLCLLQLGAALLLAGGRHQPLEFCQRGVDAVAPLLLDDPSAPLARHELAGIATG